MKIRKAFRTVLAYLRGFSAAGTEHANAQLHIYHSELIIIDLCEWKLGHQAAPAEDGYLGPEPEQEEEYDDYDPSDIPPDQATTISILANLGKLIVRCS